MGKHRFENTMTRSDEGVFVLHTWSATYTGYQGFVTMWAAPMDPADSGLYVSMFDNTEGDFLTVIAESMTKPAMPVAA